MSASGCDWWRHHWSEQCSACAETTCSALWKEHPTCDTGGRPHGCGYDQPWGCWPMGTILPVKHTRGGSCALGPIHVYALDGPVPLATRVCHWDKLHRWCVLLAPTYPHQHTHANIPFIPTGNRLYRQPPPEDPAWSDIVPNFQHMNTRVHGWLFFMLLTRLPLVLTRLPVVLTMLDLLLTVLLFLLTTLLVVSALQNTPTHDYHHNTHPHTTTTSTTNIGACTLWERIHTWMELYHLCSRSSRLPTLPTTPL